MKNSKETAAQINWKQTYACPSSCANTLGRFHDVNSVTAYLSRDVVQMVLRNVNAEDKNNTIMFS